MLRELSDGVHETSKFKKLKLAIRRLKKSNNESKTLDIRKQRGSSSLGQANRTPRYVAGGDDFDPSLKRKRIGYAVQPFNDKERKRSHSDIDSKETGKWNDEKDSSFEKEEPPHILGKFRKSERTMWAPNKKKNSVSLKTEKPYCYGRGSGRSETEGNRKSKVSMVDRKKYGAEVEDSGHNFARKSFAESNSDGTNKRFNQGQSKISSSVVSIVKPWKKSFNEKKKTLGDELQSTIDDQPRKRKRIRLDPHDTSNKRLDDSIITNETVEEKKENHNHEKDDDSLSMNAQFRAIRPSPSVLSFVEDNLLGRRRSIELRRAGYNIELPAPLDNIPSTNLERERIGENVFRNKLTFFAAAKVSSSFPPPELPEIAFAGRSNVGKSSLLNSLTRQWGVVRTSDKPGLTQTINFFNLGPKVCLVDLPGYGFAYAKDEVKESWEELVKEYVSTRVGLRQVCLLIDTKWGMKPRDHELIDLMERSQTKYQVVLTKTDTVFPIDVARRAMQIEENLKANRSIVQPVMMVSSKSGAGIQSLRTVLAKIARFAKL